MKKIALCLALLVGCGSDGDSPRGLPETETPGMCQDVSGVWDFASKEVKDGCEIGNERFTIDLSEDDSGTPALSELCGPGAVDFSYSGEENEDSCEFTTYISCSYSDGSEDSRVFRFVVVNDTIIQGVMVIDIFDPDYGSCRSEFKVTGRPF